MNILKNSNNHVRLVYIVLLFLCSATIIVSLFPTQGKFKYEYQKGTPWQHESLIAPFNFAIYKGADELKVERDSVLRMFMPYFLFDNTISTTKLQQFDKVFNKRFSEAKAIVKKKHPYVVITPDIKEKSRIASKDILSFIFKKGVIDFNDILNQTKEGSTIVVLYDKVAEKRNVGEVFNQKIAYNYINKRLKTDYVSEPILALLIENLKLYDFVEQNLSFDQNTSDKVKGELVNGISLTRGMIQAGERIISKGDLVYSDNFRVLESLRKEYESILGSSSSVKMLFLGQMLITLICLGVLFLFLFHFRSEIFESFLKTAFILMMVLVMVVAALMVDRFNNISIYLIPFAAIPIIIRAFYDSRLAFFIHLVTIVLCGFIAPNGFEFIFLQFITGAVSIFSVRQMHRRGQLFYAVVFIVVAYCISYLAMGLMQEESISKINFKTLIYFAANGLLLLTCYPLIFVLEKIFGFLSDVTLLELSDTNHPALRELAEKAPGTFQHVIQVANLAEEATRKIGGNSFLVRVGALYHDIGKTGAPSYFIENQLGKSLHDELSYEKSAEVIIRHVHYGIELAKKYNLPQPIIDFIATHHGNGLVKYFYTKYSNEHEGEVVDASLFTYPGPAPFTKEQAVLMISDSVEAASRTLKEYNEESIGGLVESIVSSQMDDNQFYDADITFKEIGIVKEVLKQKLMNIYHSRIEYPEEIKKGKVKKSRG